MSGALSLSVAAGPTTVQGAANLLSMMSALNGVATDFTPGSQIRTLAESVAAVGEIQGVAGQALALQALMFGALSLFNIAPSAPTFATGAALFATSIPVSGAPNAPQAVDIPVGTLVQTAGGVQFTTLTNTVLASGTSSVLASIIATTAGAIGNVSSGAITGTPLTSIGYPLYVINTAPTGGGSDAGTHSSALALFTAKIMSLGLASPVAAANAAIGVVATGTGEVVQFASNYESWLAAGSGAGSGVAGFTIYIDNGTGGASTSLLAAVRAWINGSAAAGQSGYRPAGVPWSVQAVTPVYASAAVSGLLYPGLLATGSVAPAVTSGITDYFNSIGIAPAAAYQPQIAAKAADAGLGAFQSLTVSLYYSGSATPVPVVSGAVGTRVILASLTVNIGVGS